MATDRRKFFKKAAGVTAAAAVAAPQVKAQDKPVKKVHYGNGKKPEKTPLFNGTVSYGNLVFIERMNEAIRVKGEYVPIDFVETALTQCPSLGEFALWRKDCASTGHEVVVYTESDTVNADEVRAAIAPLPRFMRPLQVIHVAALPRTGVGKVQRAQLNALDELDRIAL